MDRHSSVRELNDASPGSVPLARLPTNATARHRPVHRWFNFVAGFSPELVEASVSLEERLRGKPSRLLDPFSGCGTAPLAARQLGVASIAYEAHPFFAAISEAKANSHLYWADLGLVESAISRGVRESDRDSLSRLSGPASAYLRKLFREEDIVKLCSARDEIERVGLGSHPLAILVLSRVLDLCCLAATDGVYKAPASRRRAPVATVALERVLGVLESDERAATLPGARVRVYGKSSESMDEIGSSSVDLVVTSPPYVNNFDYAEMTRMYLYFWRMAASWSEITTRVRSRLVVNTTTALSAEHRMRQQEYRDSLSPDLRREADAAVATLAVRRRERAGRKQYHLLIYPYFSQMQRIVRETHRVLKRGAGFHMTVSDAALYGVHIPAPIWLARILAECGFREVRCELVRRRGRRWVLDKREGSAQGLGEYYVVGRAS